MVLSGDIDLSGEHVPEDIGPGASVCDIYEQTFLGGDASERYGLAYGAVAQGGEGTGG